MSAECYDGQVVARSLVGLIVIVIALLVYSDRRVETPGTVSVSQPASAVYALDRQAPPDAAAHLLAAPADAYQSTAVKVGPAPLSEAVRRVSLWTATTHPLELLRPRAFPRFLSTPLLI